MATLGKVTIFYGDRTLPRSARTTATPRSPRPVAVGSATATFAARLRQRHVHIDGYRSVQRAVGGRRITGLWPGRAGVDFRSRTPGHARSARGGRRLQAPVEWPHHRPRREAGTVN